MDLNPLHQIEPVVIVTVAAIFAFTLIVLRKIFYLPYINVMEARERRLARAEQKLSQAEQLMQETEEESGRILERTRQRADKLLKQTQDQCETRRRHATTTTGEEVGGLLEAGRAKIRAARQEDLSSLREHALDCVGIACAKLIGETDRSDIEAAVDKMLARRVD